MSPTLHVPVSIHITHRPDLDRAAHGRGHVGYEISDVNLAVGGELKQHADAAALAPRGIRTVEKVELVPQVVHLFRV